MGKKKILASDIEEPSLRQVCEKCGTDWLALLTEIAGGDKIYIPQKATLEKKIEARRRNKIIQKSRKSPKQLAQEFGITVERVRQIKIAG